MRLLLALVLLAVPAFAKPPVTAVLDAKVTKIGPTPMGIACGILMVTQSIEVEATRVVSGNVKKGDKVKVDVMTCFPGPLLRSQQSEYLPVNPGKLGVELDPAQIREKSLIHIEIEDPDPRTGHWFATTDKITVTKR